VTGGAGRKADDRPSRWFPGVSGVRESVEQPTKQPSAWAREARRRYDEIRAGRARTIDNDGVFARLRARFG
jgi:hypothetical protein